MRERVVVLRCFSVIFFAVIRHLNVVQNPIVIHVILLMSHQWCDGGALRPLSNKIRDCGIKHTKIFIFIEIDHIELL